MSYTYTTTNTTGAGLSGTGSTGNITLNGGSHIYTTNTGTTGQFLTSSGSNGTAWTIGTTTTPYDNVMIVKNSPAELEVKGRMVLNGRDLEERLKIIEKVLTIPERDVKLEKKHPKLKKMHDDYIKELSKYRMWESIKGDDE
jgi:hypothetical protein